MPAKKKDYIDLRSPKELPNFNRLIDKHSKDGILILVHADYCGPCQQYKKEVWNDLVANPQRTVGMAGIHHDQLENSPFSDANIKGYPSVLYVSKNGTVKEVANFKDSDTGTNTNAMPSSDMRNKELMETIIMSSPEKVPSLVSTMEANTDSNTPAFDEEATEVRNNITAANIQKKTKTPKSVGPPPRLENDTMLNSQSPNNNTMNFSVDAETNAPSGKGTTGGSLFKFLKATRHKKKRRRSTRKN